MESPFRQPMGFSPSLRHGDSPLGGGHLAALEAVECAGPETALCLGQLPGPPQPPPPLKKLQQVRAPVPCRLSLADEGAALADCLVAGAVPVSADVPKSRFQKQGMPTPGGAAALRNKPPPPPHRPQGEIGSARLPGRSENPATSPTQRRDFPLTKPRSVLSEVSTSFPMGDTPSASMSSLNCAGAGDSLALTLLTSQVVQMEPSQLRSDLHWDSTSKQRGPPEVCRRDAGLQTRSLRAFGGTPQAKAVSGASMFHDVCTETGWSTLPQLSPPSARDSWSSASPSARRGYGQEPGRDGVISPGASRGLGGLAVPCVSSSSLRGGLPVRELASCHSAHKPLGVVQRQSSDPDGTSQRSDPRDFRLEASGWDAGLTASGDRFVPQCWSDLPRDLPRARSSGALSSRGPQSLGFGTSFSHFRPQANLEQKSADHDWEFSAPTRMREASPLESQLQILMRSGSAPLVAYQSPQQRSLRITDVGNPGIAPCWPPPPLPPVAGKLAQRIGALEAQQSVLNQLAVAAGDARDAPSGTRVGDSGTVSGNGTREAFRDADRELMRAESMERLSQHDDTVTCVTMGSNPETDHRPASAQAENERLRFEIRSLQTMLNTERSFREDLQSKHAAAETDLHQLRVDLERLQASCDSDTGTRQGASTDEEGMRWRRQEPRDAESSRLRINFSQLQTASEDPARSGDFEHLRQAEAAAREELRRQYEAELRQAHAEVAELKASGANACQQCAAMNVELQRSRSEFGEVRAALISEQAACREAQGREAAGRVQLQKTERRVAELTSQASRADGSEADMLNASLKAELVDALKARDEARGTMEELGREHMALKSESVLQREDVAKVRAQLEEVLARVGGGKLQMSPQELRRQYEADKANGKKQIKRASSDMQLGADQQVISLRPQGEAPQGTPMRHATTDFTTKKSTIRDPFDRDTIRDTYSSPRPPEKTPATPPASGGGITVDLLTDRGRLRPQTRGGGSGSGSQSRSSSSRSRSQSGSGSEAGRPRNVVDLTAGMPQR